MAKWFRKNKDGAQTGRDEFGNYEVPNFPATVHDVLALIRADESSNSDIADGLGADPGMTVRVLRLVNSAGFGLRQGVEDVSQAVQLIGRSSLESILISAAVHETLPGKSAEGFDGKAFWQVCAQRAVVAGALAGELCPARRSLCWTAGLLQDLAIPLLVEREGAKYCSVLVDWSEGQEPLEVLEREVLGTDHVEVATRICEQWAFPSALTEAIGSHHEPQDGTPLPERLVAFLRPGPELVDDEPAGVAELLAAAEAAGVDPKTAASCVARGLADAGSLVAMLR